MKSGGASRDYKNGHKNNFNFLNQAASDEIKTALTNTEEAQTHWKEDHEEVDLLQIGHAPSVHQTL
jgi:hypothetical protein